MKKAKILIEVTKFTVDDDDDNLERVDLTQIPPPRGVSEILILFYSGGFFNYTKVIKSAFDEQNKMVWDKEGFSYHRKDQATPPRCFLIINNNFFDEAIKAV